MAKPRDVTDAMFEQEVLKASRPVLVECWTPWCGPCRMVAPIVEELAGDYSDRMDFFRLNTDDNPHTADSYNIHSIPVLMVFNNGEQLGQVVGYRPKSDLKQRLDTMLEGS